MDAGKAIIHQSEERGLLLTAAQREHLMQLQKSELRTEYRRRIEIMLLADQGHSQSQICQMLQCSNETARYWYSMAYVGQIHLWKTLPIGRPKTINDQYLERLKELVSNSPRDFGYSFRRWTAQWLSKHLESEFNIVVSTRHINRLLKKMGISTRYKSSSGIKMKSQQKNSHSSLAICDIPIDSQSNASKVLPFPTHDAELFWSY